MKAAIYTRISLARTSIDEETGEEITERDGVERQYTACLELANRLGWNVIHHFDDNDISAYSGKTRDGFEALLIAIEEGEVDALICWHVDRLYRSLQDLERLIVVAEARNIAIRTVNSGEFDLSTSAGKMVARILGSVSRQESEHKAERHKLANAQARAAGKWRNGGAAVFGYDAKGQVVEHEGVLIRKAAIDLLAERSVRSLTREWNEAGILTRRGGKWSALGFRYMMLNPRYAGLVTHQGKVVGKCADRDDGGWEPILDEETHLAVTALLTDPARRSQHSFERRYTGSGVYRCGVCGGKLRPVSSKPTRAGKQATYGCPACYGVNVKVETLDAFVSEVILEMLAVEGVGHYITDDTEDVTELARRRDGLQARLDELGRMFATGEIDGSQLRAGSAELHQQLAGINSLIASLLRTSPAANLLHGDGELRERWDACSAEMRGRIIDELVTVTVMPVGQARGRWGKIEDRVTITPK